MKRGQLEKSSWESLLHHRHSLEVKLGACYPVPIAGLGLAEGGPHIFLICFPGHTAENFEQPPPPILEREKGGDGRGSIHFAFGGGGIPPLPRAEKNPLFGVRST